MSVVPTINQESEPWLAADFGNRDTVKVLRTPVQIQKVTSNRNKRGGATVMGLQAEGTFGRILFSTTQRQSTSGKGNRAVSHNRQSNVKSDETKYASGPLTCPLRTGGSIHTREGRLCQVTGQDRTVREPISGGPIITRPLFSRRRDQETGRERERQSARARVYLRY